MIHKEDAQALVEYLGDGSCDHWDHHGYCQTHGLGEAVQVDPMRCAMGRALDDLKKIAEEPDDD